MKFGVTTLVLSIALTLMAPLASGEEPLTFEKALEIGLRNNYDILIARNEAAKANNNRGLGTAGFLPRLNATGSWNRTDTKETSDPVTPNSIGDNVTDQLNGQLALSWTVFDGFSMFAQRSRFNQLARLGEEQARSEIENAVVGIGRGYFSLVQQELLLDVAVETRDVSAARLEKTQVRRELGGASSTDLLNAQVALNRDESDLIQRQIDRDAAVRELNVLLGRDPAAQLTIEKMIVTPAWDLSSEQMLEEALANNAGLKLLEASRAAASSVVKSSYAPYLPSVNLNASYGYLDRTVTPDGGSDLGTEQSSSTVGVSLAWNLFNGGRDRVAIRNAKIDLNNQVYSLRNAENEVRSRALEAMQTYEKQLELVNLEMGNVEAAEQNLELIRDRLGLGSATSLEFRDAQTSLALARTSLIAAQFQARLTRLVLDQITGRLVSEAE